MYHVTCSQYSVANKSSYNQTSVNYKDYIYLIIPLI